MNRSLCKRLLSAVLAVVLLMAINASPAAVWAAEREQPVIVRDYVAEVNPVYAHLTGTTSEKLAQVVAEEAPLYKADNVTQAGKILRGVLKAREAAVLIEIETDLTYDAANEDAFWDAAWLLAEEIRDIAWAHSGDPQEGDYLQYSVFERSIGMEATIDSTVTLTIQYGFTYHSTAAQENQADSAVDALLASWDLEGASDYEKVCMAYDWLCQNVVYAQEIVDEESTIYSAYGALVEKECVCQGYAAALYRLLLEMDVDCRVITGIGNGGPHAWNIIEMGSLYYNADATWDASYSQAGWEYQYFLKSAANFPDHYREAPFSTEGFYAAYPMGSVDYVYVPGAEEPETGGTCGENAFWSFENGVLTISGTGAVTENPWLEEYADSIVFAVIEDGITYLCDSAFDGCGKLTAVSIGNTVQTLGYYAFRNCTALENVTIPGNVLRIGNAAFAGCTALTQVTLEEGVEFIQLYAFSGSGLTGVVIPASVTDLGVEAFGDCASLEDVQFLGAAPEFDIDVFKNVAATVRYPAGDTWTEEVLQQYGGTLTWVAEYDLFVFVGTSVSLGDSLDVHFFLDSADVEDTSYAVLTRSYADDRADHVVTVPYSEWFAVDDLLYVTYDGIAAKEMGDEISIVIYDAVGNAISETYADSIQDYAMRMLETRTDAQLLTLLVDMLNYGAAAQSQFGYDVEDPVNEELTEAQKDYATGEYETVSNLSASAGRAATSLTLKNRITLDILFKNSVIGSDYSQLYAIVSYTDHYGDAVQIQIEGSDFKVYDEECGYVSVPGLAIADYGQAVTCIVYDANGNVLAWTTDSIEGYAHRMADQLPAVVEAIVKFGISAYRYFH